jgi:hypothetical protein
MIEMSDGSGWCFARFLIHDYLSRVFLVLGLVFKAPAFRRGGAIALVFRWVDGDSMCLGCGSWSS